MLFLQFLLASGSFNVPAVLLKQALAVFLAQKAHGQIQHRKRHGQLFKPDGGTGVGVLLVVLRIGVPQEGFRKGTRTSACAGARQFAHIA